jgi:hypothetical protein
MNSNVRIILDYFRRSAVDIYPLVIQSLHEDSTVTISLFTHEDNREDVTLRNSEHAYEFLERRFIDQITISGVIIAMSMGEIILVTIVDLLEGIKSYGPDFCRAVIEGDHPFI